MRLVEVDAVCNDIAARFHAAALEPFLQAFHGGGLSSQLTQEPLVGDAKLELILLSQGVVLIY